MYLSEAMKWATIVEAGAVVMGIPFAVRQLAQVRRSQRLAAVMPQFEAFHTVDSSNRRRLLYDSFGAEFPDLSPPVEEAVRQVIHEFDFLGYLVRSRLVDKSLVLGLYFATVQRQWLLLEPYVADQRSRRGTPFAANFEWLARRARRFRRFRNRRVTIQVHGDPYRRDAAADDGSGGSPPGVLRRLRSWMRRTDRTQS